MKKGTKWEDVFTPEEVHRMREHIRKLTKKRGGHRPVIATKYGVEFPVFRGVPEAAAFLGISPWGIYNVLHGRNKASHGYKFRYAYSDQCKDC